MPTPAHRDRAIEAVACAVVSVSDTRTPETDKSGTMIREFVVSAGHVVHTYALLRDEPVELKALLAKLCQDPGCDAVLITGGTGLATRDGTYEVVASLLDKRIDGFGELFRLMSREEIGAAAMLSRAVGGVMDRTIVFSMPGSTGAVKLAMEKLILPELGHIAHLVREPG